MITRLEVDGFKSLRDFEIDLEPFTVLVGPNGAGKSNILEALALISRLGTARPEDALKQGRGRAIDQFWRHGDTSAREMALSVETFELHDEGVPGAPARWAERMRYQLQLARDGSKGSTDRVKLSKTAQKIAGATDRWFEARPEWQGFRGEPALEDAEIFEYLPHLTVLQLEASHLREPSERIDTGVLAADASNLPSILASLPEATLGEIRAEFVGLIPGIADFTIVEVDESYQIEFKTRDRDVVPARLASDGTLRMLALLTSALGARNQYEVLCIEEPENGIYPGRLRRLIDLLREVTDSSAWRSGAEGDPPPQVIVTTHSPVFLTALKDHEHLLRYVDVVRKDRHRVTRARPLAAPGQSDPARFVSPNEIGAVLVDLWPRAGDR